VAVVALPATARAELVYFARGGQAQLPAEIQGDSVRLETPDGPVAFLARDFRKIVPGYWPGVEWASRRSKAIEGNAEARYAAAWWALENGLTPEAVAMVREAASTDPKHPPVARMLAALKVLETPAADPDLDPLLRALGSSARIARGPHVVLVHQHSDADAAERIDLLERVVTSYYLMFASQGVELAVPGRRMASAWFADRADYLAFLRDEQGAAFATTRGYFHPTLKVVFAYDARSDESQKAARQSIALRRGELRRLADAVESAPPRSRVRLALPGEAVRVASRASASQLVQDWSRELDRKLLLLEMDRRAIDLGTAAHEMIHQVVAESRLIARHDDFPLWLHEGLAAQFEVVRGGRWAGIGRAHDLRLPDWRSAPEPARLAPLVQDIGFGRGYQRTLYAQAWALVYFLRKEHPDSFLTFLDLLRSPDPADRPRRERYLAAFHDAFGDDLRSLETAWHAYMDAQRTPLETESRSHAPGSTR
jgi:hypothetical protein